jgi:hypothetical protein
VASVFVRWSAKPFCHEIHTGRISACARASTLISSFDRKGGPVGAPSAFLEDSHDQRGKWHRGTDRFGPGRGRQTKGRPAFRSDHERNTKICRPNGSRPQLSCTLYVMISYSISDGVVAHHDMRICLPTPERNDFSNVFKEKQ